jgi:uncharacterized protein YkwD
MFVPIPTLRSRRAWALVVLALFTLTGCLTRQEQSALDLLNQERARAGVAGLAVDDDAQEKAQAWAKKLAAEQQLSHSHVAAGIEGNWLRLGENVAAAGSVEELHRVLMSSADHRARLLDGRFTHVGIGISRAADGSLYTAQVFVSR